jgi:hypothetical protein
LALLLGSVIYSAKIVVDFFECQNEISPKLAQLEDLAKTLVSERESETTLRDQFLQRLAGMRESMESLQVRSDTLKKELIEQQTLQNPLQLETNREVLRECRKVVAG